MSEKTVFLSEEQIINALSFSLVPSLIGEHAKNEQYLFTSAYDSWEEFIGYIVAAENVKNIG